MIVLLKLAWKNIKRHPGKNFLLGLVIFLANWVFFMAVSLTEEANYRWRAYFSNTFLGEYHLTTLLTGEKDYTIPALTFPEKKLPPSVFNYLHSNKIPYSPRLKIGAAVFNEATSSFEGDLVTVVGINWKQELIHLQNLKFSDATATPSATNSDGVWVWKDLARKHHWKSGDTITLYMKDKFGGTYPYSYQINGILGQYQNANLEGKGMMTIFPLIFVDVDLLSKQLGIDANEIYEIALPPGVDTTLISQLSTIASNEKLTFFPAEQGFGAIYGIVDFVNFIGKALKIFVLIILVAAVFNLNMMGIFERQKEIGTILAIGARPGWIVSLLFLEHILFASIIFIITIACYSLFVWSNIEIPIGEISVMFAGKPIRTHLVYSSFIEAYLGITFALLLSGIYPTYLAARLNPAEVFQEGNI